MTDTPYGVTGCLCPMTGDPVLVAANKQVPTYTDNPHCPYHGILPRNRTDTGVYRVVSADCLNDEPSGQSCEQYGVECTCGDHTDPDGLDNLLRKGIEQARRGETIDRGVLHVAINGGMGGRIGCACGDIWPCPTQPNDCEACAQYGECLDCQQEREDDDGSPPCDHCHNFGHSFEDCPHAYCDPDKGEHVDHTLDEPFARLMAEHGDDMTEEEIRAAMDVHNGGCNHQSCDHVWDPRDGRIKTHEEARRDDGIPDTDAWHRVDGLIHDGAAVDCRQCRVSDAATRTARVSAELNARLAPVDDGGTDNHLCITPDTYYCPTSGETESACHGGFDTCCDRPDLHVTGTDTCRPPCPRHCPPTPTSARRRPWWKRLRIRLR